MKIGARIQKYLNHAFVMQLATTNGKKPWACTVYFVIDENLNIYWLSLPTRRHSIELQNNPKAAVTMPIKTDQPIIGLGAEGLVGVVTDAGIVDKIMPDYIKKYDNGKDFLRLFKEGKNEHQMYIFKPSKFVLVDEVYFPGKGSIDWIPKNEDY